MKRTNSNKYIMALFAISLMFVAGCKDKDAPVHRQDKTETEQKNNALLHAKDLPKATNKTLQDWLGGMKLPNPKKYPKRYQQILAGFTRHSMLLRAAKRENYQNHVAVRKITERAMVRIYLQESLFKLLKKIEPSTEELKTYYKTHIRKFMRPEMRKISQIFIRCKDEDTTAVNCRNKIVKLRKRAASESFYKLAQKHSEDPISRYRGGVLGFLLDPKHNRKQLFNVEAQVVKSAFQIKKEGTLSPPIKGEKGVFLIRLDKILPQRLVPFQRQKSRVKAFYMRERRKEIRTNFFKRLEKAHKAHIFPTKVAKKKT